MAAFIVITLSISSFAQNQQYIVPSALSTTYQGYNVTGINMGGNTSFHLTSIPPGSQLYDNSEELELPSDGNNNFLFYLNGGMYAVDPGSGTSSNSIDYSSLTALVPSNFGVYADNLLDLPIVSPTPCIQFYNDTNKDIVVQLALSDNLGKYTEYKIASGQVTRMGIPDEDFQVYGDSVTVYGTENININIIYGTKLITNNAPITFTLNLPWGKNVPNFDTHVGFENSYNCTPPSSSNPNIPKPLPIQGDSNFPDSELSLLATMPMEQAWHSDMCTLALVDGNNATSFSYNGITYGTEQSTSSN